MPLVPVRLVAGTLLTSRSAASTPVTGWLKFTVNCVKLLTTAPAGGSNELTVGDDDAMTYTRTTAEVAGTPRSSDATAVRLNMFVGTFSQVKLNGAVGFCPIFTPLA